jgi:hypothetical protein
MAQFVDISAQEKPVCDISDIQLSLTETEYIPVEEEAFEEEKLVVANKLIRRGKVNLNYFNYFIRITIRFGKNGF